mmetsp:Transcript_2959/g.8521  ORF Transcript_2959/g.8521 Transcript_2959/m.8521 type:complete len:242 (-) Transcript_2959:827-1552(-)
MSSSVSQSSSPSKVSETASSASPPMSRGTATTRSTDAVRAVTTVPHSDGTGVGVRVPAAGTSKQSLGRREERPASNIGGGVPMSNRGRSANRGGSSRGIRSGGLASGKRRCSGVGVRAPSSSWRSPYRPRGGGVGSCSPSRPPSSRSERSRSNPPIPTPAEPVDAQRLALSPAGDGGPRPPSEACGEAGAEYGGAVAEEADAVWQQTSPSNFEIALTTFAWLTCKPCALQSSSRYNAKSSP